MGDSPLPLSFLLSSWCSEDTQEFAKGYVYCWQYMFAAIVAIAPLQ